jgi:hypothetical protein
MPPRDDRRNWVPPAEGLTVSSWISRSNVYRDAAFELAQVSPGIAARQLARGLRAARQPRGGQVATVRRLVEALGEADPLIIRAIADDVAALAALAAKEAAA